MEFTEEQFKEANKINKGIIKLKKKFPDYFFIGFKKNIMLDELNFYLKENLKLKDKPPIKGAKR